MEIKDLLNVIKDSAFEVRKAFAPGYLESVYQNALAVELQTRGIEVKKEVPLPVFYKNVQVGDFRADLLVEGKIIIELKAVSNLITAHEVQFLNYLHATGVDDGLLINYGSEVYRIIHKTRVYSPKQQ